MELLVHAMLNNALAVTVLAVLVAMLGRACRRPALIHGLWLVVMLKLITPPIVPVTLPVAVDLMPAEWSAVEIPEDRTPSVVPNESCPDLAAAMVDAQSVADPRGEEGLDVVDATPLSGQTELGRQTKTGGSFRDLITRINLAAGWSWEHLVLALVLSGAVAWWVLAFVRIIRFNRLMKEIAPAPEEWQTRTAELAGRLGLFEVPSLCLVPGRVPPMLWAIGGQPRLLVPAELWSATSLDERTSLLLHELAHLKRRDHWVRWLELIVGGLYWWHPAVWWGRRLLREAEEQCCDAWVVWAMPQGAKTYATALLTAIDFVSGARTAPAASSATSGNGHVSCLKRRLKMILRAQTPKGLSWAGRLAVLGTAALLLPLAPSWGQKSDAGGTPVGVDRSVDFLLSNDFVDLAQERDQRNPRAEPSANSTTEINNREFNERREQQIREEFIRDPEVIALRDEIAMAAERRDQDKAFALPSNDPARRATEQIYKKLMDQYQDLWKNKHDELLARLSQDKAKKDEPAREDRGRETAERFEKHVKELIEKLTKELGPIGEELRKIVEKSVDEIHETLKKEGVTPDDLRKVLEKSHEEVRKGLEKGGTVNKELREAVEKSRRDLQEEWERARNDLRSAMRDRVQPRRQRERGDEAQEGADQPKDSAAKEAAELEKERKEIEKVRSEVRTLEQQLRQANRRLVELQRRSMTQRRGAGRRSDDPSTRVAPGRVPSEQPSEREASPRSPRSPRSPVAPATPASPRRAEPPGARQPGSPPRRPQVEREESRGSGVRPEYEERLRNLDEKLERLLKEIEKLKDDKKPQESKNSNPRRARTANPGTPVVY